MLSVGNHHDSGCSSLNTRKVALIQKHQKAIAPCAARCDGKILNPAGNAVKSAADMVVHPNHGRLAVQHQGVITIGRPFAVEGDRTPELLANTKRVSQDAVKPVTTQIVGPAFNRTLSILSNQSHCQSDVHPNRSSSFDHCSGSHGQHARRSGSAEHLCSHSRSIFVTIEPSLHGNRVCPRRRGSTPLTHDALFDKKSDFATLTLPTARRERGRGRTAFIGHAARSLSAQAFELLAAAAAERGRALLGSIRAGSAIQFSRPRFRLLSPQWRASSFCKEGPCNRCSDCERPSFDSTARH